LQLAETLTAHLQRLQLSQAEAAALCGVSQPRISELLRGVPIGLEALVNMAALAGLVVDLRVLAEV
jgi:predicted XRE-type DNA-binding protein